MYTHWKRQKIMLSIEVPRLREVIFGIRPGVLVPEFATHPLDPTRVTYAGLHPFSKHRYAMLPIPWRYAGAIPDPPLIIIACGYPTSAHKGAKLSETATGHGIGRQIRCRVEGRGCAPLPANWPEC